MNTATRKIEDELLVMRAQDGEAEAFDELVRRWNRRLWHHAWVRTGSPEAAWDVTQESWAAIVRGIRRLEDPAAFGAWAHGIVARRGTDWVRGRIRGRRVDAAALDRAQGAESMAHGEGSDETERVRVALRSLNGDERALLMMRHVEEMPVRSIAAALGVPEGTVKSRLHAAREALRRAMEVNSDERD